MSVSRALFTMCILPWISLNEFAENLGVTLSMVPFSPEPYKLLAQRVKVIVVPSLWEEAFGRIPIECAVNGIPSVVAKIGGLPEAASQVLPNSLTFTAGDYQDLRQKIDLTSGNSQAVYKKPANDFVSVLVSVVNQTVERT